uniref:Uncharacterized protein n=1 Tax=Setaria italica TaxID=4555 RepID=K4A306_SETIT
MENVVSIYYGGTVERDEYGCVKFVGMQCEVVIFDEKPSFSELVARAREELHCHENDEITVEGILHLGSPLNIQRKMVPIRCAGQWEKYVRTVMNGHSPSVEVVVRPVFAEGRDDELLEAPEAGPSMVIEEGKVLPLLRSRAHDGFLALQYDDRYTPLLQMAGLDVISYQVRRGMPKFNSAAITALVDRYYYH